MKYFLKYWRPQQAPVQLDFSFFQLVRKRLGRGSISSGLVNMAAIAQISSLQEWEEEWQHLEEETRTFKVYSMFSFFYLSWHLGERDAMIAAPARALNDQWNNSCISDFFYFMSKPVFTNYLNLPLNAWKFLSVSMSSDYSRKRLL